MFNMCNYSKDDRPMPFNNSSISSVGKENSSEV